MLKVKRNNIPVKYPKEFGEVKALVQMRDKNICCGCGDNLYDKKIYFHHIDANINNNKLTNVATVCSKCHGSVHSISLVDIKVDKNWIPPKIKMNDNLLSKRSNFRFKGI